MEKTLTKHVQELNETLKKGGLDEETRMSCLAKIGSIVMYSNICDNKEVIDACNYIDKSILESDGVDGAVKALISLANSMRGVLK